MAGAPTVTSTGTEAVRATATLVLPPSQRPSVEWCLPPRTTSSASCAATASFRTAAGFPRWTVSRSSAFLGTRLARAAPKLRAGLVVQSRIRVAVAPGGVPPRSHARDDKRFRRACAAARANTAASAASGDTSTPTTIGFQDMPGQRRSHSEGFHGLIIRLSKYHCGTAERRYHTAMATQSVAELLRRYWRSPCS